MNDPQKNHKNLYLFSIALVLSFEILALGLLLPALPFAAERMGAGAREVGLLFAAQYAGQFLTAPLWGQLSDQLGRRPVMMLTLGLAALASVATAIAPSLWLLFAARAFAGLASGNVSTASAYIADVTDARSRSTGMALIGIAFGVGFTLGPALGAWLVRYGDAAPFWVASLISACNLALAAAILREPLRDPAQRAQQRSQRALSGALDLLQRRAVAAPCGLNLLYTVAVSFLEVPFAFYLASRFQGGLREYGAIMATLGLTMILVQGGLVRRLAPRLGDALMTRIGLAALAFGLVLAPGARDLWALTGALMIASVGRALVQPGLLALTSRAADPSRTGQVMGLFQSSASLGRIVGPALGGLIYAQINPAAPFWAASIICGLALTLSWLAPTPPSPRDAF
jgi:DHA1 family tetracycline resistance protein-like MFS transporter